MGPPLERPSQGAAGPPPARIPVPRRSTIAEFFHRHPIAALAVLTPGIVEYLFGSSSLLPLVAAPPIFLLFLAVNVGQYTAGVLLIREAMVRGQKGWASVGLWAIAYGIVEEGLGDNTLFRGGHGADGILGVYGHFLGVNWVWSFGVLALHVVVSVSMPIVVLGLALPESRGRSLLRGPGIVLCFLALAGTTAFESLSNLRLYDFWMGGALFTGCWIALAGLLLAGGVVPSSWGRPRGPRPTASRPAMFAAGAALFPALLATEYLGAALGVPPFVTLAVEAAMLLGFVEWVRRHIGRERHDRALIALAAGLVVWVGLFGTLLTRPFPYPAPLLAVAIYFFWRLDRAYRPTGSSSDPPASPPPASGAAARSASAVPPGTGSGTTAIHFTNI